MNERKIRVRFAPSPTGPLHIGGVRTALYNYLFAKKHGGDFLLRIEDTDQTRFVPGAEEYIMEALRWCGIQWDEGVGVGGPHAPYKQSERKEMYKQYAMKLVEAGKAYYAFDTPEELDAMRARIEAEKSGLPQYDARTRGGMKNSLTLPADEVKGRLENGDAYVIRIMIPENEEVELTDLIRGHVKVHTGTLDDKVLFKSDGMPTYHLANVVDDYLMEITHVIRGEEWLPSAPLHVLLYRYLGWSDCMPAFAHLPLLLKPDGNGKLSKRDGDRLGFPVFPLRWVDPKSGEVSSGYRESGYFSPAFVNMLALLGWNPGSEQEIFDLQGLIDAFSLERVGKSGSKFDPEKAKWFNHQYMLMTNSSEIASAFKVEIEEKGITCDHQKLVSIVELMKDRITFVSELWGQTHFFFQAPEAFDEAFLKKKWKPDSSGILAELIPVIEAIQAFDAPTIDQTLHAYFEKSGKGAGQVMVSLRIALVGAGKGPDVKDIMALIGKQEVINRIQYAIKTIA